MRHQGQNVISITSLAQAGFGKHLHRIGLFSVFSSHSVHQNLLFFIFSSHLMTASVIYLMITSFHCCCREIHWNREEFYLIIASLVSFGYNRVVKAANLLRTSSERLYLQHSHTLQYLDLSATPPSIFICLSSSRRLGLKKYPLSKMALKRINKELTDLGR